jgi:hypothetical protein
MATHTITLEVDSTKMFDTLLEMQRAGSEDWPRALGDRMASLLMTPKDVSALDAVGLAFYGITVRSVEPCKADN